MEKIKKYFKILESIKKLEGNLYVFSNFFFFNFLGKTQKNAIDSRTDHFKIS